MINAQEIITKLHLQPHPEGGWFKEIHRSVQNVKVNEKPRSAMTSIYFLMEENQVSRWHEVDADEAWHFYEGDALELLIAPPDFSRVEKISLNEHSKNGSPVFVVPAGWWQAARSTGAYSLVGCTVAPGFEFSGFRFLTPEEKQRMDENNPEYKAFL